MVVLLNCGTAVQSSDNSTDLVSANHEPPAQYLVSVYGVKCTHTHTHSTLTSVLPHGRSYSAYHHNSHLSQVLLNIS